MIDFCLDFGIKRLFLLANAIFVRAKFFYLH